MTKVKAALLRTQGMPAPYARSRPIEIAELDLEGPQAGEVLVKVRAAALCHSDLSIVNGTIPRPLPMVIGHEASGTVVECGPGVMGLSPGDQVVMVFVPRCGHCLPCSTGRPVLCEPGRAANGAGKLFTGATRFSIDGQPVFHQAGVSAFAEHVVVSEHSLVRLAEPMPYDEAALFGCGVLTGVGAVFNSAGVKPGSTVAVVGLGGVGLSAVMGAVAAGARQVVAVDMQQGKLDLAASLGATNVVNAGDADVVEKVRALTRGGVDYAIEAAGVIGALDVAYRITRMGGTTVGVGLAGAKTWPMQYTSLVGEERTLKGSFFGSTIPTRDIPNYIAMYQGGSLPVDRLKSSHLRLEDINQAMDELASGAVLRQIIMF